MADKPSKFEFTPGEVDMILSALALSATSFQRLSNRAGAPAEISEQYRKNMVLVRGLSDRIRLGVAK